MASHTAEIPQHPNSETATERTFIHPKTGRPTTMNTANIGRGREPADEAGGDHPAAAATSPPARRQPSAAQANFEASLRAQGAWAEIVKAVGAIAALPSPATVIDVVMQTTSHGEQFETFESAIAWLNGFLPLYREAEPRRWQHVQERLGGGTPELAAPSSDGPGPGVEVAGVTSIDKGDVT
jgi:hypothetical protein